MAVRTRQVTIYTCDSPYCRNELVVHDPGDADSPETVKLPQGFHGSVTAVSDGGTVAASYFACKTAHIKDAALAMLEDAADQAAQAANPDQDFVPVELPA